MLLGLLLAGNLAGFGGSGAAPVTPAGGGGAHRHRGAAKEWTQKFERKWQEAAEAWVEQAQEAPQPAPVSVPRELTQLERLVARTANTPTGNALVRALANDRPDLIAHAAMLAERAMRDDEATALLLLMH